MRLPRENVKHGKGRPKKCGRCNKPKYTKKPDVLICKCGKPTVMTPEVIAKLDHAFSLGVSDKLAYNFAGISADAFYDYLRVNPMYSERRAELRSKLSLKAVHNVAKSIQNENIDDSKWYLERRHRSDYSTRQEMTGADGEPIKQIHKIDLSGLKDDELRTIAKILAKTEPESDQG